MARLLLLLARPLPASPKARCESWARLLKNMALLAVQPPSPGPAMKPRVMRAILDGLLLGALFGVAAAYYFYDDRLIVLILLPFLALLMVLITVLSVSGDLYVRQPDEFQEIVSNQASSYTLKVIGGLLVLLLFIYLFFHAWRADVIAHLCIVLFLARIVYLFKLAQLRWREIAATDLSESVETFAN
jgi:hypothetical protein